MIENKDFESLVLNPLWHSISNNHPPPMTFKINWRLNFLRFEVLVFEINDFSQSNPIKEIQSKIPWRRRMVLIEISLYCFGQTLIKET